MTAKEFMNRPFELNRIIRTKTRQLESLRSITTSVSLAMSGMPHSPSPDPHRTEALMVRVISLEQEIADATQQLDKAIAEVTQAIKAINNPTCEDVLTARYLCFEDWVSIAAERNFSRDWVMRLHRKGLNLVKIDSSLHESTSVYASST